MAHFLCHWGCSHFGALLLDFYFTENIAKSLKRAIYAILYDSKVVVDILSTTIYSEATSFILIKMTIWFNQITWSL